MSWFKVDDSFPQHRKVLRIPRRHRMACIGLWISGAAWCSRHLSDGWLDKFLIDELGGSDDLAALLIDVGLWEDKGEHVLFHNWSDFQTTRAQVEEKKEKDAERKRKSREVFDKKRARSQTSDHAETENVTTESAPSPSGQERPSENVTRVETETHTETPTPTHTETPTETEVSTKKHLVIADAPTPFDDFWSAYPRKVAKTAAVKAWKNATRKTTASVITAGAVRYRDDPNREPEFTAHPASWLNAGRWDDEPLPARRDGQKPTRDENVAAWGSLKSDGWPRAVES